MWLQALLTPDQLKHALSDVLPMQIALDPNEPSRYLEIDNATVVESSDQGVRIETSGRLQWDVVGIKVPLVLRRVTVTVMPSIELRDDRDALVLSLRVDAADVSAVPEFVEAQLLTRLNQELLSEHARLVWDFTKTLDFKFVLPASVTPAREVRLFAREGAVRTSDEGVVVAARFDFDGG